MNAAAGVSGEVYSSESAHSLGVNWVDIDNDGWVDLFAVGGAPQYPPRLFRNLGDGTFEAAHHLVPKLPATDMSGSIFADYDNDGDRDIYVYTDRDGGCGRGPLAEWPANPSGQPAGQHADRGRQGRRPVKTTLGLAAPKRPAGCGARVDRARRQVDPLPMVVPAILLQTGSVFTHWHTRWVRLSTYPTAGPTPFYSARCLPSSTAPVRLVSAAWPNHWVSRERTTGAKVANLLAALDELKAKVGIPLSIRDSGLEEKQWLDQIDQLAARDAEGRDSMHAWNGTRAELKYAH